MLRALAGSARRSARCPAYGARLTPGLANMSTAMNFGSKSFQPRPPDKGSFPLDHFGERRAAAGLPRRASGPECPVAPHGPAVQVGKRRPAAVRRGRDGAGAPREAPARSGWRELGLWRTRRVRACSWSPGLRARLKRSAGRRRSVAGVGSG